MRIQYIDKLKGLTIILVVIHHVAGGCGFGEAPILTYESFNMPMFMFLSGIFAFKSIKEYRWGEVVAFFKKKALRLLVPFIMIGGIFSMMAFGDPWETLTGKAGGYWFFPALFYDMLWGLVALYAARLIAPPLRGNTLIANVLTSLAIFVVLSVLYLKGVRFPYFLHAVKMFPFFYCGALFGMSGRVKGLFTENNTVYSIAFVAFFALQLTDTHTSVINLTGLPAIIILMNLFSRYDCRIPQWLSTVGTYSLEIYVFQWFLLPDVRWIGPWLMQPTKWLLGNYNLALMLAIAIAISLLIVALCMALAVAVRHSRLLNAVLLGGKWSRK